MWKTLKTIYDAHPPRPLNLDLKTFDSISVFPPLEAIKTHTNISSADAEAARSSHVAVTKELVPYPSDLFAGQGIVILAGGRYTGFATTGLGMLREIGSKLPIEVWVKDQSEEREEWCAELAKEGVACRRLSDYMDTDLLEHGYQLKISAILFSSFEQILFLDADNVPVVNPDVIFTSKSFTETGVVMWPDYWKHTGAPYLPYIVGLSDGPSELLREDQTAESGQLVWDKRRHWKVRDSDCFRKQVCLRVSTIVTLFSRILQLLWASALLYYDLSRLGWMGRQGYFSRCASVLTARVLHGSAQVENAIHQRDGRWHWYASGRPYQAQQLRAHVPALQHHQVECTWVFMYWLRHPGYRPCESQRFGKPEVTNQSAFERASSDLFTDRYAEYEHRP